MIAFNGQYLPAASHGNMRITAACLGGQWVIGGKWLTPATQQAIIAAFGAEEGIAVIRRTNDYLNRIATTDPTRAQQLAMFINEDPLLVTSLVETSKVRWLVSSEGVAQISTTILQNSNYNIEVIYMAVAGTGGGCMCSTDTQTSDNFARFFPWSSNNKWYQQSNVITTYSSVSVRYNEKYHIKFTPNGGMVDLESNEIIFNKCGTYTDGRCWALQSRFDREKSHFALFKGTDGINTVEMYPFIRNGENGMLDIISGTFHPNANTKGSFTIAITDKTHA